MKNREIRAFFAIMMSAALIFGNAGMVQAAEVSKDETVYIRTDASGKETSITVSDELKNIGSQSDILDISKLLDIENVKGDEPFSQSGETIKWQNNGSNEICYQGTSKGELPVGMRITYELDGKKLPAEKLKGKSGHLKIHVKYENYTDGDAYVPFLMATGMVLDHEVFQNIEIEHGKLISDGEKETAVGYGIPGLSGYLKTEEMDAPVELEIPEGFTVEADVTEYDGITCMSMATSEVFGEIITDEIACPREWKDAMDELQDASNQLVDGSGELKEGMDTLFSSTGELQDASNQLAEGGKTLSVGTGNLSAGANQLNGGARALAEGTGQLAGGSKSLVSGAAQVAAGSANAKNGAKELDTGLGQIKKGVSDMKKQAGNGITQLYQGADGLVGGIAQAKTGADQLAVGTQAAQKSVKELADGLFQVKQGTAGIQQLAGAISASLPGTVTAENVPVHVTVDNSDIRSAVEAALQEAGVDEEVISNTLAVINDTQVDTTTSVTVDVNAENSVLAGYVQKLGETVSAVDVGLSDLETGAQQLEGAMTQLHTGAGSLAAALAAEGDLSKGAVALQNGIGTLGQSLEEGTDTLLTGIGQLKTGSSKLHTGLSKLETGAGKLSKGAKSLDKGIVAADKGAKELSQGTVSLSEGASTLEQGALQLSSGLGELQGGTKQLRDGAELLDSGAGELKNGMEQFQEEGICELVSIFEGDLDTLLDKVNVMITRANAYKNYSGISQKMNGEVKFIFMTEE